MLVVDFFTLPLEHWRLHNLASISSSAANDLIRWRSGEARWVTLNVDGALNPSSSIGSAGGLLRDHEGSWLLGFNKHLGISSTLEAELWGILEGLCLAWLHGFERVQCQTDSSEAYDLITSRDASSSPISLVRAIANYISKSWMLDYVLIKR
ncbi:hypothetical protein V6N11_069502 [Hibiscus sabdariffa]|uniref:RNase H type-1 domain-containing protein n=1 Tax=Hibiscus sabdariffa TaxID=183260 RepID=A0ABR2Q2X2_9ROSI